MPGPQPVLETPPPVDAAVGNAVLERLPPLERQRIVARCTRLSLPRNRYLHRTNEPITHAYFLLSGMASIVAGDAGGQKLEIGMVGSEGLVGAPLVLGSDRGLNDAFMQIAGDALAMPAHALMRELEASETLSLVARREVLLLLQHVSQSALCNANHPFEQRLCRWLCMTQDRVGGDQLDLTQEFLSQMLGARRPTVTVVAGRLQQAGLIRYKRGKIDILDRLHLQENACDCYRVVAEAERILRSP